MLNPIDLRLGDFREVLRDDPANKFDAVIMDWMYPREYLPGWTDLGVQGERVLKPGAPFVSYAGTRFLVETLHRLDRITGLRLRRVIPIVHASPSREAWKPLIALEKPPLSGRTAGLPGFIKGSGRSTRWHPCEQPIDEVRSIIREVTRPGDLILDPCCGSGTTLLAARLEGRRAVGIEIDEETYEIARKRLGLRTGREPIGERLDLIASHAIQPEGRASGRETGFSPDNPYVGNPVNAMVGFSETDFPSDNPF